MNQQQTEIYQRIQDYFQAFGDLRGKLAENYDGNDKFIEQLIQEYSKFVLIAVTVKHKIVPSRPIDRVWHQHLLFTKSYWTDFCQQTLGQDLHHLPSNVNEKEQLKNFYKQTLTSLETVFKEKPPANIWPSPDSQIYDCSGNCASCSCEV